MQFSYSFDPIAFLAALYAIVFTYIESRRNNEVIVKIIKCNHSKSSDKKKGTFSNDFTVILRNHGITLHDPHLALFFRDMGGFSQISCHLDRVDDSGQHSQFTKGMIAEFRLRACDLDSTGRSLLPFLTNPTEQNARLLLFSQGYLAQEFRIGDWKDRLKERWNRFAYNVNSRFDKTIDTKWGTGIRQGNILPELLSFRRPLIMFKQMSIEELHLKEPAQGQSNGEAIHQQAEQNKTWI